MKILRDIKKKADKAEEEVVYPPVTVEAVEKMIKLLKVSKETGCIFKLCLAFQDGEFFVDSASFQDVEFLKKTKLREESLLISYHTSLLLYQTTIKIADIRRINLAIQYKGDD